MQSKKILFTSHPVSILFTVSFQTETWRNGPNLPLEENNPSYTPYNGSFLLAGGYSPGNYEDKVFSYDQATKEFVQHRSLKTGRTNPFAVVVPDEFVTCRRRK